VRCCWFWGGSRCRSVPLSGRGAVFSGERELGCRRQFVSRRPVALGSSTLPDWFQTGKPSPTPGSSPLGSNHYQGREGVGLAPQKAGTAGRGGGTCGFSCVLCVLPPLRRGPGGVCVPPLAPSPRCCSLSACLGGINYFCQRQPCGVGWSLGSTSPPCRPHHPGKSAGSVETL